MTVLILNNMKSAKSVRILRKRKEYNNISIKNMLMENQDDLGIDIHQIEQIFVDEYERQKDNSDGTFRILSNDITEQELKLPPVAYQK